MQDLVALHVYNISDGKTYAILHSPATNMVRVFDNDECIYLSDSLNDCKEIVRHKALNHLQQLAKEAKDNWYKLAYGYLEMFEQGKVLPEVTLPATIPIEGTDNCNCLSVDPHNCEVHGIVNNLEEGGLKSD
jgi:hypothetical protein